MNLTLAPPRSFLTSLVYISKPLTMSLPTWANGPVIGAMKPMRNSSAAAPDIAPRLIPITRIPPITVGPARQTNVFVTARTPCLVAPIWSLPHPPSLRRRGHQNLRQFRLGCAGRSPRAALAKPRRYAHQAARKVKDGQDVESAQRVLPPRDQRAEVLAQEDDDTGADGAAHQRARTAEHHHQQSVDRRRQHHVLGADMTVGVRPEGPREPAEAACDDEGDVFVQPGIVAENAHAHFALANALEASSER